MIWPMFRSEGFEQHRVFHSSTSIDSLSAQPHSPGTLGGAATELTEKTESHALCCLSFLMFKLNKKGPKLTIIFLGRS
jgi:hypothetical protein